MKLYKVTNGFIGYGEVKVFVVATNEERAIELARDKFKEECDRRPNVYNKRYYKNLQAECICADVNTEWASEVQDE